MMAMVGVSTGSVSSEFRCDQESGGVKKVRVCDESVWARRLSVPAISYRGGLIKGAGALLRQRPL